MKLDRFIRLAIGLIVLLLFVIAIAAMLFITESALNVWDRLLEGPRWILFIYIFAMTALVAAAIWLVFRLTVKRKPRPGAAGHPLDATGIRERLHEAEKAGVDVSDAQQELQELAARQHAGSIHLCFFGEVSSGKSSLVKAMVPDANVLIDVIGGSTEDIRTYRWRDDAGNQILLTDVPGSGGHDDGHADVAMQEAARAHIVLYVCDGDLSRSEVSMVSKLLTLDKPLIVVLNKSDRYTHEEQSQLMQKLLDTLTDLGSEFSRERLVAVSAGGELDVVEKLPDGSEAAARRSRPADIGVLVVAINSLLERDAEELDARRDRAVFRVAADKLAAAEAEYREQRAAHIIRASTRKAVIGALAAVSPGTDVIIQGYIGTAMTRELCSLYGATPRDVDIEDFLNLSQSRAGKALPLTLAVAGNGLKAFPGMGTVTGGVVHAVAYGLIFDALGRSLVATLSKHGELQPRAAADEFGDGISEYVEAGVRQVAEMALDKNPQDRGR